MFHFSRKTRRDKSFLSFAKLLTQLEANEVIAIAVILGVSLAIEENGEVVEKDGDALITESLDSFIKLSKVQKKNLLKVMDAAVNGVDEVC